MSKYRLTENQCYYLGIDIKELMGAEKKAYVKLKKMEVKLDEAKRKFNISFKEWKDIYHALSKYNKEIKSNETGMYQIQ